MKLFKNIMGIFCAVLLIFSAVPPALAQGVPYLYFTGSTVTIGGGSGYCYLRMNNAESIAAMDYIVIYDSKNLELTSNYTTGFTNRDDVTVSINDSEPGKIHVTLVSQNGLNGSDYLNLLYFKAKQGAKPGTYPISVLVNDIYNSALETVIAEKKTGTITVKEQTQTVKSVRFSGALSASALKCGENLNYKLSISMLNGLSAGMFDFTYDESKLHLNNVMLSDAMKNTVCDVNTSMPGLVKISFAAENAVASGSDAVTLNFTALSAGESEIRFKSSELYDDEFNSMSGNELAEVITVTEPEQIIDSPDFKILLPEDIRSDKEFTIKAVLEKNSGVRAGDFALLYDGGILECLEVKAETISGAWVVADKEFASGRVRFSLMSNVELQNDTPLVSIRFKSKENKTSKSTVSVSGTGVYNADFKEIQLDYKTAEISAVRPEYTVNFYDSDGKTLLFTQKVMSGNSAIPPETEKIRKCDKSVHLKFGGWDKEFSAIADDTDFIAVYTKEAHSEVGLPSTEPGIDTPGLVGGSKCETCGETIKEGSIIPPTGAVILAELNENGILNITGALSDNEQTENSVLLGVYSGSKLLKCIDISAYNQNNLTLQIKNMAVAETIKIFRWETLSSIKPIDNVIVRSVRYTGAVIKATLSEDNTLTISGALSDKGKADGAVLVGVYGGERLIRLCDISSQSQSNINLSIENMAVADTVKIFRWDSLSNLKPTSDALEVEVLR